MKCKVVVLAAMLVIGGLNHGMVDAQSAVRNLGASGNQNTAFENSFGSGGQIGHLQAGGFGSFTPSDRWIGIGRPTFNGQGLPVYGMRIQDRGNQATFSLNSENNSRVQDLEIQWGGVPGINPSPSLNFNFANNNSTTTELMTLASNGNLTLRRQFILQNLQGQADAGKIFVNGTLGIFDFDVPNALDSFGNPQALDFRINNRQMKLFNDNNSRAQLAVNSSNFNSMPNVSLFVNGNGHFNGTVSQTSDLRFKENVAPLRAAGARDRGELSSPTERLLQLEGVTYNFKKGTVGRHDLSAYGDKTHIGFIAQEVEELFPELVSADDDGFLGINYTGLIPVLVEGVKDQQELIGEQAETIESLASKLEILEKQMAILLSEAK